MADSTQATAKPRRELRFKRRRGRSFGLGRRITAIDVDGQVLRLVQTVHRYGRTRVTRFAAERLDLAGDSNLTDPTVMGLAISKALSQLRWKSSVVVMGLPRANVVLRTIQLPPSDHPGELASMVHFQVAKDLPFPIEEAVIDFTIQGEVRADFDTTQATRGELSPNPESQVRLDILVAAVKKDDVRFYQQTAAAAGFKLAGLGLRSYANARCVEACQLTSPNETVALVSLRPDEVIIDVLSGRSLVFSRVATVKQPDDETPEETEEAPSESKTPNPDQEITKPLRDLQFAQTVTIEVVRSLHSFQGTVSRNPVARVVVAGGTSNEQDVVQALQNRLSIPANLLNPAAAMGLPESVSQHASAALAVFGLGIGVNDTEGMPFDFLQPKQPSPPPSPRRVKVFIGAAVGAALLVMMLGLRAHLAGKRHTVRNSLTQQIAKEKKNLPTYKRMQLQVAGIRDWRNLGRNWLDEYVCLTTNMPPQKEVYLSSLSLSSQGIVRMSVLAKSGEILARLEEQLRTAGYQVKPLAITPGTDKAGYPFRSSVEVILPDRTPPKPGSAQPGTNPSPDGTTAPKDDPSP